MLPNMHITICNRTVLHLGIRRPGTLVIAVLRGQLSTELQYYAKLEVLCGNEMTSALSCRTQTLPFRHSGAIRFLQQNASLLACVTCVC